MLLPISHDKVRREEADRPIEDPSKNMADSVQECSFMRRATRGNPKAM